MKQDSADDGVVRDTLASVSIALNPAEVQPSVVKLNLPGAIQTPSSEGEEALAVANCTSSILHVEVAEDVGENNGARRAAQGEEPPTQPSVDISEVLRASNKRRSMLGSASTSNGDRPDHRMSSFDGKPRPSTPCATPNSLRKRSSISERRSGVQIDSLVFEELDMPEKKWRPDRLWAWRPAGSWGDELSRVHRSKAFSILMTLLTLFVLVGEDIRLISAPPDADEVFDWLQGFCFLCFSFEIVLSCTVQEDYFPGFWFMADLFATLSMIPDFTFVSSALRGPNDITTDNLSGMSSSGKFQDSSWARALRSSRIGSRIARLLRVGNRIAMCLRVFRLENWIKFSFLRRSTVSRNEPGTDSEAEISGKSGQPVGDWAHNESRVGKKLSERTPQRVVIIVLALLVFLPMLQPPAVLQMMPLSARYGADVIYQAWLDLEELTAKGLDSEDIIQWRWEWEVETLTYIHRHRYDADPESGDWMFRLCWLGFVRRKNAVDADDQLDLFADAHLQSLSSLDPSRRAEVADITTIAATIPKDVFAALSRPWIQDCSESKVSIIGVSLDPSQPCPRRVLRTHETIWYMPSVHDQGRFEAHFEGQFIFIFDVTARSRFDAVFSILQTFVAVIVLAIGAFLLSRDVDKLVLLPIERMMTVLEKIRVDPTVAGRLCTDRTESKRRSRRNSPSRMAGKRSFDMAGKRAKRLQKHGACLETKMLENTIVKLGSLLALGFGEAGMSIVAENLEDDNAIVTAQIPGKKVEAIFGLCEIQHFHLTTEILKDQTVVFVNRVAAIVHTIVDDHMGAPNKNFGQAFLLVWQMNSFPKEDRSKVADLSVMAFIKVTAEVGRDRQLAKMREHPLLRAKLPDCRGIHVGVGLHFGWAIAGGIGSEFKIDASYLSPHVNLTSQLEEATQDYGVVMLLSEPLIRTCSKHFSKHFRPVDRVQLQGSKLATQLFTIDLEPASLNVNRGSANWQKKESVEQIAKRRASRKHHVFSDTYQVIDQLSCDRNVARMRQHLTLEFYQEFEKGFLNYIAGEWDVASTVLSETRTMLRQVDGPSDVLLNFMKSHSNSAPPSWPGWRRLNLRLRTDGV